MFVGTSFGCVIHLVAIRRRSLMRSASASASSFRVPSSLDQALPLTDCALATTNHPRAQAVKARMPRGASPSDLDRDFRGTSGGASGSGRAAAQRPGQLREVDTSITPPEEHRPPRPLSAQPDFQRSRQKGVCACISLSIPPFLPSFSLFLSLPPLTPLPLPPFSLSLSLLPPPPSLSLFLSSTLPLLSPLSECVYMCTCLPARLRRRRIHICISNTPSLRMHGNHSSFRATRTCPPGSKHWYNSLTELGSSLEAVGRPLSASQVFLAGIAMLFQSAGAAVLPRNWWPWATGVSRPVRSNPPFSRRCSVHGL